MKRMDDAMLVAIQQGRQNMADGRARQKQKLIAALEALFPGLGCDVAALAELIETRPECSECTMPGGAHMEHCPNG